MAKDTIAVQSRRAVMLKMISVAVLTVFTLLIAHHAVGRSTQATAGDADEWSSRSDSDEIFDFTGTTLSAPSSGDLNEGHSRIDRAFDGVSEQGKYLFLYFHKNSDLENLMPTIREAKSRWGDEAYFMEVNVNDPAERAHVTKYRIRSTPMLLAIAPNGAVTAGFKDSATMGQVERAFLPEAMAEVVRAIQSRQTVYIVIGAEDSAYFQEALSAVEGSVSRLEGIAHSVVVDPNEESSETILRNAGVENDPGVTQTLVVSPGGGVVARFVGEVTERELLDSFGKVLEQSKGCGARTVTGGSPCEPGRGVSGGRGCGARVEG
jgi:hypothetical protein